MGLSCGATLMKYFLFIFNMILFLVGACMLALGIWILTDNKANDYFEIINDASNNPYLKNAAIILVVAGCILFFVGFFGCCGACKESSCLLVLYATFLILIFLVEVAAAVLAVIFQSELNDTLKDAMADQVNKHVIPDTSDATSKAWLSIQYEFKCCGSKGPADYHGSKYETETKKAVPETCCKLDNCDYENPKPENYDKCISEASKSNGTITASQVYTDGCYDEIKDWMKERVAYFMGAGFGLAFVQLIGIIFACCLRKSISNQKD